MASIATVAGEADDFNFVKASIRQTLLEVIEEASHRGPGFMQLRPVMSKMARRLQDQLSGNGEQAVLAAFQDLFRSGLLAWGWDLANPEPPWFHITDRGRETLKHWSRDPSNPDGYLAYLDAGKLDPIARSYIEEAIATYSAGCFKAAAVMVGGAAERLLLRVAGQLQLRLASLKLPVPKALGDWRVKTVRDAVAATLAPHAKSMPKPLSEAFGAYWPAFVEQIRGARNDAGHPASVDPVTPETVHAALLIFPELVKLSRALEGWIQAHQF